MVSHDDPAHILSPTVVSLEGARRYLGQAMPDVITARGDVGILHNGTMALFCSIRCPGDVILRTYDLARALRDARITVVGGFHSPMEKECLDLLLRGTGPVVICPARSIE